MSDARWKEIAIAARQAGPSCPDDEALHRWIDEGETGSLTGHVEKCVRCQVEVDEMRAFLVSAADSADAAAGTVVRRRLEQQLAAATSSVSRPPRPARPAAGAGRFMSSWPSWLAAAAVVTLAAGLAWQVSSWRGGSAPALPSMGSTAGPFRGAGPARGLTPSGPVSVMPPAFRWESVGPGGPVEFRLESADGAVIWTTITTDTRVILPANIAARLSPGNRYVWRVTAVDDPGSSVSATVDLTRPR